MPITNKKILSRKGRYIFKIRSKLLKYNSKYLFGLLFKRKSNKIELNFSDGSSQTVFYRNGGADFHTIHDIIFNESYALRSLKRFPDISIAYDAIISQGKIPLIIDAGSNIGASVVYFSKCFPEAHIIGIEPQVENYLLLTKNTQHVRGEMLCGALGAIAGTVNIVDPGLGQNAYRTEADANGSVPLFSMSDLIAFKSSDVFVPFLAKIDIEGGEKSLFSQDTGWVNLFSVLMIELHDWLLPREQIAANFLKCISNLDRDFLISGENIISIKNSG